MQQQAEGSSTYSYATLRYVEDARRDVAVPVGVILWDPFELRLRVRLPRERETLEDVPVTKALPFLSAAQKQLQGWLERRELPYCPEPPPPLSDQWWAHVRRLMKFSVRVDPPRPLDCADPDREIEGLFDALVQPKRSPRERARQLEQAIGRALGRMHLRRFQRYYEAPGFLGRPVKVLRGAEGPRGLVVVDGVNLALRTAEADADRLASKLGRVLHNAAGRSTQFVIGYLASPGDLNGETPLKEWIEKQSGSRLYNLDREAEMFRETAEAALADTNDALGILVP